MAKYAISQEGADAMMQLSTNIISASNGIKQATTTLKNQILQYMDELGVYGLDIWAMTLQIDGIMEDKQESLENLSEIAKSKAEVILSLIGGSSNGNGLSDNATLNSNDNSHEYEGGKMLKVMKVIKGEH